LWDAECGRDAVGAGDGHLGYDGFDECLLLVGFAGSDDLCDVLADLRKCGRVGYGGLLGEFDGEHVVPGAELLLGGTQRAYPVLEVGRVERAVLEGVEVAVDPGVYLGEFGVDAGEFVLSDVFIHAVLFARGVDGLRHEVVLSSEECGGRVE
jgi:hypothetical protein